MSINKKPIPHRVYNPSKEHPYVAGAVDIIDDRLSQNQQDVNQDTYRKSETYSKEQLNNLITTPEQQYVTVTADDQTTDVTDVLPAEGTADTVYRVGNWDGEQYDPTVYSEYAWDGTEYVFLDKKEYTLATADDFIEPDAEKRAKVVPVGAAADVYGYYEENHEYVRVELDGNNKILEATKKDGEKIVGGDLTVLGSFEFSNVKYKVVSNYEWIYAAVDNSNKVVYGIKRDGKFYADIAGVDKDFLAMIKSVLSIKQEFGIIGYETDADGKILSLRSADGIKKEFAGFVTPFIEIGGSSIESAVDNENRVEIKTDSAGKIVCFRDKFGVSHEKAGICSPFVKTDALNLSEEGISKLEQDLIDAGFSPSDIPSGGNNGEVLATDGNGNHYWKTVPTTTTTDVSQTFGVLVDQYESLNIGVSFAPAIRRAIEVAGEGGTIVFTPNKTYNIDDIILMQNNQVVVGNGATLKRMNESKAIVSNEVSIDGSTCTIIFTSVPDDWSKALAYSRLIGTSTNIKVYLFDETDGQQGNYYATGLIQSISGNSVTFRDVYPTSGTIPVGTIALRSYVMMLGSQYEPVSYKVFNLVFDGNKANNDSLHHWSPNNTMHNYGHGGLVDSCKFIDIPNENIVAQGIVVRNCYAKNLNGSFIHLSCPSQADLYNHGGAESYMGTFVIGNFCENIMIVDQDIMGHNLAPVTYSWNPGKLVVIGNQFYGNNTSKCIYMDAKTPDEPVDSTETENCRYAVYIGNMYVNFPKIGDIPLVTSNLTKINTRLITNNIFRNCGTSDMRRLYQTDLMFENNLYDGNTAVNTGGNSKSYRLDTEISSTPSASSLTSKYANLPIGGSVYITQIDKMYKKILTDSSTISWTEENISIID